MLCHLSTYHCLLLQRTKQCGHPVPPQLCVSCHRPPDLHHWCPSPVWAYFDSDCHCDLPREKHIMSLTFQKTAYTLKLLRQMRTSNFRNNVCTKSSEVSFPPCIKLSIIGYSSTVSVASRHTNNNLAKTRLHAKHYIKHILSRFSAICRHWFPSSLLCLKAVLELFWGISV